MVELALDSHSSILIDSYHTKDAEKKTYIAKCVEDIKKVQMYLSHLSHVWMVQGRHRGCIMIGTGSLSIIYCPRELGLSQHFVSFTGLPRDSSELDTTKIK